MGTSTWNSGVTARLPNEVPVARIVGVGGDGDAGGEQLGARRGDDEALVRAGEREGDVVERAGLRRSATSACATAVWKSTSHIVGANAAVDVALLEQVAEESCASLRQRSSMVAYSSFQSTERASLLPEGQEGLLVVRVTSWQSSMKLGRDTVAGGCAFPTRRRGWARVSPARRAAHVHADVEVVLHATLRGQAVVVPAHRVVDVLAPHALVADDDVGLRVAEDVADVQRARDGRRRGVDDEGLLARARRIVAVEPTPLPCLGPAPLDGCGLEVLGEAATSTAR